MSPARFRATWDVSMKSGLEDRNNLHSSAFPQQPLSSLNEVRPGRPEQYALDRVLVQLRHVSMKSGLEDRNNWRDSLRSYMDVWVSMKSGLEDRNNALHLNNRKMALLVSMKSGLEDRNNRSRRLRRRRDRRSLNEVRPGRPEQ